MAFASNHSPENSQATPGIFKNIKKLDFIVTDQLID
jgi:hypothetical protein